MFFGSILSKLMIEYQVLKTEYKIVYIKTDRAKWDKIYTKILGYILHIDILHIHILQTTIFKLPFQLHIPP